MPRLTSVQSRQLSGLATSRPWIITSSASPVAEGDTFTLTASNPPEYSSVSPYTFSGNAAAGESLEYLPVQGNPTLSYVSGSVVDKIELKTLNDHQNATSKSLTMNIQNGTVTVPITEAGTQLGVPTYSTGTNITSSSLSGINNATIGTVGWRKYLTANQSTGRLTVTLPSTLSIPCTIEFYGRLNGFNAGSSDLATYLSVSNSATDQFVGLMYKPQVFPYTHQGGINVRPDGGFDVTAATDIWTWHVITIDASWVPRYYHLQQYTENGTRKWGYRNATGLDQAINVTSRTSWNRLNFIAPPATYANTLYDGLTYVDYHTVRISNINRYGTDTMITPPDPYTLETDGNTVAIYRFA
jgi:hypothetical protein